MASSPSTTPPAPTTMPSTTAPGENFSQPIHWWEDHGSRVISEFYTLFEGIPLARSLPHLTHLIPSNHPSYSLLIDLHAEIRACFYCAQESIKCLRSAEEDSRQGRSGHGETFWKDTLDELVLGFRRLWVEFRREVKKCGSPEEEKEKRTAEIESENAANDAMMLARLDEFFEVEVTGERGDANAEVRAPRTSAEDLKYWRSELKEEWDMELSE